MKIVHSRRVIGLLTLDQEENDQPWITVCSFLNPHDISARRRVSGGHKVCATTPTKFPHINRHATRTTKTSPPSHLPASYPDASASILPSPSSRPTRSCAPDEHKADGNIARVLEALKASKPYEIRS